MIASSIASDCVSFLSVSIVGRPDRSLVEIMGARFYTGFRYRGNEVPAQVLISPLLGNWLFVSNFNVENVEASKKQKILCLLLASKSKAPQLGLHLQIPGQMFYAALRPVEPFFLRSAHLFFIMS